MPLRKILGFFSAKQHVLCVHVHCPERSAKELLEAEPLEELRQKAAEVAFGASLCGLTILRCAPLLWWALSNRIRRNHKQESRHPEVCGTCPHTAFGTAAWKPSHRLRVSMWARYLSERLAVLPLGVPGCLVAMHVAPPLGLLHGYLLTGFWFPCGPGTCQST